MSLYILPANTVDGYIAAQTFKGTCTAEIFEDFLIAHLLPRCDLYPGPGSVVVLDNAPIHHANIEVIEKAYMRKVV